MDLFRSKKNTNLQHLQKAYDESYQASLRALTAESQSNSVAALSAWKNTSRIISLQLSTITDTPKTYQESAIMSNIMKIEHQCRDRIASLERGVSGTTSQASSPVKNSYETAFSNFSSDNVHDASFLPMEPSKPKANRPTLKSDSSLPNSLHSNSGNSSESSHSRSSSRTENKPTARYHSASSIEGQNFSMKSTHRQGITRTPSPQLVSSRSMLHTLRSGKGGMNKLLEERKAASDAAVLAWKVKQSNPDNAKSALAAASISTGNGVPVQEVKAATPAAQKIGSKPVRVASKPSTTTSKSRPTTSAHIPKPKPLYNKPVVFRAPQIHAPGHRPASTRTQSQASASRSTATSSTKRHQAPPKTTAPVARSNSGTGTKARAQPEDQSDESDISEDEMDKWLTEARKKVKKIKGIDENAAENIFNEVVVKGDPVYWDDIAGLEKAKTSLKETVVYPFLRPDLFSGLREPAQGMLLFGPPGTGKTMLARAVAQESNSTFFSISASSLTSKFLGESEKLVRALFLMARALAPSIIFVDEIDSLLSARSDSGEHETSRRIKTEFLVQWSALQHAAAGKDHDDVSRVLVLAATNLPWVIDEAARRRFVRRQYIPLPEAETRKHHLEKLLSRQKNDLSEKEKAKLVKLTDGFSGSDLTALAKDAAMGPLRALGEALLTTPTDQIRPIGFEDFKASLSTIRPSVSKAGLKVFEDWAAMYGSSGA